MYICKKFQILKTTRRCDRIYAIQKPASHIATTSREVLEWTRILNLAKLAVDTFRFVVEAGLFKAVVNGRAKHLPS